MASIRRINGSRKWYACITRADGTRTNVATKTHDRTKAQQIADRLQEVERMAGEGRATTDQVRRLFNEVLARNGEDQLCTETAEQFLNQWLKSKTNPGTAERYKNTVRLFLKSLEARKGALLTSISYKDVVTFMEARHGAAPKTILVDVKTLNTAFNVAKKMGHIQHNPVEKALTLHPIKSESSKKECFKTEQVAALVATAAPDWRTAILLGFYTGARLGDCANMNWANINLKEGYIDYLPEKTRKKNKRLRVPIHVQLRAHLEALRPGAAEQPLCPSLEGRDTGGKTGLSEAFRKLMEQAGVKNGLAAGKGKRQFSKWSFHSFRHSFNSSLANSGVDQETRMELTGHSSADINREYTHLEMPKLKAAIEKLPSLAAVCQPKPDGASPPGAELRGEAPSNGGIGADHNVAA